MKRSVEVAFILLFGGVFGAMICAAPSLVPPDYFLLAHLLMAAMFSLVYGHCVVECVHNWYYIKPRSKPSTESPRGLSGEIMGLFERSLFFILTAIHPIEVITWMGGWLALKLGANWNRVDVSDIQDVRKRKLESLENRRAALAALVCGACSMAMAYGGGLIIRHGLRLSLFSP